MRSRASWGSTIRRSPGCGRPGWSPEPRARRTRDGGRVTVRPLARRPPRIHPDAWVDPAALVIGDVEQAEGVSVWPFTVVRGDEGQYIRIGRNNNVQDNSVVHVTT